MRIDDVLAQVREVQPGEYTDERVRDWIETVNQRVLRELADGYILPEMGGELVAPAPYDQLYLWWVMAQIALTQENIASYNNFIAMYNALWDEYGRMISRTYERETKYYYALR